MMPNSSSRSMAHPTRRPLSRCRCRLPGLFLPHLWMLPVAPPWPSSAHAHHLCAPQPPNCKEAAHLSSWELHGWPHFLLLMVGCLLNVICLVLVALPVLRTLESLASRGIIQHQCYLSHKRNGPDPCCHFLPGYLDCRHGTVSSLPPPNAILACICAGHRFSPRSPQHPVQFLGCRGIPGSASLSFCSLPVGVRWPGAPELGSGALRLEMKQWTLLCAKRRSPPATACQVGLLAQSLEGNSASLACCPSCTLLFSPA